ncbi:c340b922-89c5-4ebd-839d-6def88ca0143 [Sclerotinia trifoliorum]|uniref:C340b922-89c5-4ebd-839d-6def88ca0143 n=1 Tax=Sclerotinia trifoliorum TaxID=28548 RepID=A0A8H2VVQ7_9HELO|nr:c340b922-89c5-4ebd-839d-6def88ca0143 [Sclerotinia trifoliorum]
MHLQKLLAVLSSLTVVGLSTPVVSQEDPPNTIERHEPSPTIQAHSTHTEQTSSKITNKNTVQAINTIIESSLNRKSIVKPLGMGMGIIFPTPIIEQKKRGDETVVWTQPPPTSKIHPPM